MLLTGKNKVLLKKTVLATLFATSPSLTDPGMKPGLCRKRSAKATDRPPKAKTLCHRYLKIQLTSENKLSLVQEYREQTLFVLIITHNKYRSAKQMYTHFTLLR
jgi:hypothetical protein